MQRAPVALDIDGHEVYIGATVQVKWLGVWYEGTVIKIGPKRNLCKVRDAESGESVLLESKHLQFRETRLMNKQITTGISVVYNDGENWRDGVVEARSAEGIVLVSWRQSGLSEENLTWFDLSHVAPVIHNDLYKEHNRDMLEAGKSGLLHNDAIEPRPRTMDNLLYEPGSDEEADILTDLGSSKKQLHKHATDRIADGTKYDLSKENEEKVARNQHVGQPPPDSAVPQFPTPVFMALPPMMNHPYGNMFFPLDQNQIMKLSSSFTSAPTGQQQKAAFIPHPRSVRRPTGLVQTSTPCIMSYTRSTNGIPPHSTSRFFQSIRDEKLGKRKLQRRVKQRMKKSPTIQSRANSEPTEYARVDDLSYPKEVLQPEKSNIIKRERVADKAMVQIHEQNHTHSLPKPSHRQPQAMKKKPPTKPEWQIQVTTRDVTPPPLPPRPSLPHPSHSKSSIERQAGLQSSSDSGVEGRRERETTRSSREKLRQKNKDRDTRNETLLEDQYQPDTDDTQIIGAEEGVAGLGVESASPAYVTVPHGGSTLLTCVARSPRTVHYQWLKDDKPISDQNPFFTQPAPGMLQIQMASLYLTGQYKCVASDGLDSFERVFHLEVTSENPMPAESASGYGKHTERLPPQYAAAIDDQKQGPQQQLQHSRALPRIVVNGPQADSLPPPPTESPLNNTQPPCPLPSSGRDTPDIKDRVVEAVSEGVTEKEEKVAESRKRIKRDRRRASTTLKNDMEQYLGGYGENYGALSSQSLELWQQGLSEEETKTNRRKKKRKEKKKKNISKSSSQGSSSPNKSTISIKHAESPKLAGKKNVSFGKLPTGPGGKEESTIDETETIPLPAAGTESPQNLSPDTTNQQKDKQPGPSRVEQEREETNSVEVNTSVGASSAESEEVTIGGKRGEKLQLPREEESLNDSVRRLQLSVQEHCPEQLQLVEKEKRKKFLSNIFSRNASS